MDDFRGSWLRSEDYPMKLPLHGSFWHHLDAYKKRLRHRKQTLFQTDDELSKRLRDARQTLLQTEDELLKNADAAMHFWEQVDPAEPDHVFIPVSDFGHLSEHLRGHSRAMKTDPWSRFVYFSRLSYPA